VDNCDNSKFDPVSARRIRMVLGETAGQFLFPERVLPKQWQPGRLPEGCSKRLALLEKPMVSGRNTLW